MNNSPLISVCFQTFVVCKAATEYNIQTHNNGEGLPYTFNLRNLVEISFVFLKDNNIVSVTSSVQKEIESST